MARTFRQAGFLLVHGMRPAGRLEVRGPELSGLMAGWVGRPTSPYVYADAASIGQGNLFLSFELRTRRLPKRQDGFVVTRNLLGCQIAWGDTESSRELNAAVRAVLGTHRCEVQVDLDLFDGGRGVIAVRRPDALAVEEGQRQANSLFAGIVERTRQYRTPAEARRA